MLHLLAFTQSKNEVTMLASFWLEQFFLSVVYFLNW